MDFGLFRRLFENIYPEQHCFERILQILYGE